MKVFSSIYGFLDNCGFLAVVDTKTRKIDLLADLEPIQPGGKQAGLVNTCLADGDVFAVDHTNLYNLKFDPGAGDGPFVCRNKVQRPEWEQGRRANLNRVMRHPVSGNLLLAFTSMDAIDEFTPDGHFVGRKHIWDLVPDISKRLWKCAPGPNGRAYISGLWALPNGGIGCTLANLGGTEKGMLLDLSAGKLLHDGLHHPVGGRVHRGKLYVSLWREGAIAEFQLSAQDPVSIDPNSMRLFRPSSPPELGEEIKQNLAGMFLHDDTLLCSVTYYAKKQKCNPALAGFDLGSAEQNLFFRLELPLSNAFMFSLHHAPDSWLPHLPLKTEPVLRQCSTHGGSGSIEQAEAASPPDMNISGKKKVIEAKGVGLSFDSGFWGIMPFNRDKKFWALKDVSFDLHKGEILGLIGNNGAGKSTLARILTGVYSPSQGHLSIKGQVSLLALGTGFVTQLSGRDNVYIAGAYQGRSGPEIKRNFDRIVEFAGLEEHIDRPLRDYSAGMKSRLAFSAAVFMEPDILVIDEVLGTGDAGFRSKAEDKIHELIDKSSGVIIVSHNMPFIRNVCSRVLWLEQGVSKMSGTPDDVVPVYLQAAG